MTEPVNRTGFQWCEIQFRSGRSLFIILLFTVHNQGGVHIFQNTKVTCILLFNLGGGGVSIFSPKTQKCHVYFCTTKGGGSRRDPNHKSMYKCAYMYVHLSLSPPPGMMCREMLFIFPCFLFKLATIQIYK